MTDPASESIEVPLDAATLSYLRFCAQRGTVGSHTARRQLRGLAVADSAQLSEQALLDISPTYLDDMVEETEAALAEAGRG